MTDQNEREPGALDMWKARQGVVISGIAVDRAHRTEVDQARAEVERLSIEAATLRADLQMVRSQRDEAWAERCERVAWGEEGWRAAVRNREVADAYLAALNWTRDRLQERRAEGAKLTADNTELRAMCEVVERIQGERDRARDLAIRNGAFQPEGAWSSRLLMIVDRLTDERDQALYERDQCREAVEFSRGLIPTRPR